MVGSFEFEVFLGIASAKGEEPWQELVNFVPHPVAIDQSPTSLPRVAEARHSDTCISHP